MNSPHLVKFNGFFGKSNLARGFFGRFSVFHLVIHSVVVVVGKFHHWLLITLSLCLNKLSFYYLDLDYYKEYRRFLNRAKGNRENHVCSM